MEKLAKLYEFQSVDMELYNLENLLKKSASRKALNKARDILLEGQKTAEQYEKDIENKKNEIEKVMEGYEALSKQVEEVAKKSETVNSPETAKELKREAEKVNADLKKLQKDIIDGLNSVKDTQKKYQELMTQLATAKKEFIENKEIHTKEIAENQPKIDALKEKVANMSKDIDSALMEVYNKKKKNGMPVVATVKDKQCSGCRFELPSSIMDSIGSSDNYVECEHCGRILIIK